MQKGTLLLENGDYYQGHSFGAQATVSAELCFNTGMTGYQEIFTDPSYKNQILTCTHVHIGNYGIHPFDSESESVKIKGLIVRNFSEKFSRLSATESLDQFLIRNNIPALAELDTRTIVKTIRRQGAMNCILSAEIDDIELLKKMLLATPAMDGLELASKVSTKEAYEIKNTADQYRIAVLDFGVKKSMLNILNSRGASLKVFPATSEMTEILAYKPNGIFLSNGPGDPKSMQYAITTVQALLETGVPIFGICLGHQLLGMCLGISTYKLHYGHRGSNHPVFNLESRRSEITTQNHGFGLLKKDILENQELIEITHLNLNDESVEGIRSKKHNAFSVQYHPEAAPGPHDSRYLFDQFFKNIDLFCSLN